MDKRREGVSARKRRNRLLYVAISVVVVLGVTFAISRLENAAPRVDLNTVWVDTVRRGPMVREVRGIGELVPREVRWIPANTIGRVERIVVLPGSAVEPDDIIVEMSNSVLVQDAENAVWQLKGREADLINLKVQLEGNLLQLMSGLAQIEASYKQAQLEAEINEELYADGLVAELTLKLSRVRAEELETRLDIERRRLSFQEGAIEPQTAAMEADVEQFRAQADLLKKQVASLHVRAGTVGS